MAIIRKISRIFVMTVAALMVLTAAAHRLRTTRKPLKPVETEAAVSQWPDTTVAAVVLSADGKGTSSLRLFGYEKTLSATRETIFIENLTDNTIKAVTFTIKYLNTDGRMIHRRTVSRQRVDIPPHEIRRVDIRSWDTQRTHYYSGGAAPRKKAIPYSVVLIADSVTIDMPADSLPCTL